MDVTGSRIFAAIALGMATMVAGIATPIFFVWYRHRKINTKKGFDITFPSAQDVKARKGRLFNYENSMKILMYFGGGVLLATCFIHLIPEVRENMDNYFKRQQAMALLVPNTSVIMELPPFASALRLVPESHNESDHDHDHDHHDHGHASESLNNGTTINPPAPHVHSVNESFDHNDHTHAPHGPHDHDHDHEHEDPLLNDASGHDHDGHSHDGHSHEGHNHSHGIPYVELAICGGFFVIYFLEELVHTFIPHSHSSHHDEDEDDDLKVDTTYSTGGSDSSCSPQLPPSSTPYPRMTRPFQSEIEDGDTEVTTFTGQGYINYGIEVGKSEKGGTILPLPSPNHLTNGRKKKVTVTSSSASTSSSSSTSSSASSPTSHPVIFHTQSCDALVVPSPLHSSPAGSEPDTHRNHHHRSNHHHSNNPSSSDHGSTSVQFLMGLVTILAFSAHSIFDGVAIGLQEEPNRLWTMFFAICCHKLVVALAVGMELFEKTGSLIMTSIHMGIFSLMSPLGIVIVIVTESRLAESDSPIIILLSAVATGTILYIVFFEILQRDREKDNNKLFGLILYVSMIFGFAVMSFMTLYMVH